VATVQVHIQAEPAMLFALFLLHVVPFPHMFP